MLDFLHQPGRDPWIPAFQAVSKRHSRAAKAETSFPRKRESRGPGGALRGVSPLHPAWIPAFAGMTFRGPLPLSDGVLTHPARSLCRGTNWVKAVLVRSTSSTCTTAPTSCCSPSSLHRVPIPRASIPHGSGSRLMMMVGASSGDHDGRVTVERQYPVFEGRPQHRLDVGDERVPPAPCRQNGSAVAQFRFADCRKEQLLHRLAPDPRFHGRISRLSHQFGNNIRIQQEHVCRLNRIGAARGPGHAAATPGLRPWTVRSSRG